MPSVYRNDDSLHKQRRFKNAAHLLSKISEALDGKETIVSSPTPQDEGFKQTLTLKVLNALEIPYKFSHQSNTIEFHKSNGGKLQFDATSQPIRIKN